MKRVYLDNNATTKPDESLFEKLDLWLENWANPSSIYKEGQRAKNLLKNARAHIAEFLKVDPLEIVFTSGGSESNNHAIKGVFEAYELSFQSLSAKKNRYIFSSVEHPSVKEVEDWLKKKGAEVILIPVNKQGELDEEAYDQALNENTALVSIMHVNNETGHIFPIKRLCQKAHKKGALFHSDMVQSLGKIDLDLKEMNVDLASFSAHKFYSFKGAGLLYVAKKTPLESLILGGRQERKRRAGTENLLSVLSLAKVCSVYKDRILEKNEKLGALKAYMEKILKLIEGVYVVGENQPRVSNTSGLLIDKVYGETFLMSMDLKGFSLSSGSACSSGSTSLSPVLLAMGFKPGEIQTSIRVSLSLFSTKEEIDFFCKTFKKEVLRLRNL